MKVSKRKTRSDKFPLTLHPTGQYSQVSRLRGSVQEHLWLHLSAAA